MHAGVACVRLSSMAPDFTTAIRLLENAMVHFQNALEYSHQRTFSDLKVRVLLLAQQYSPSHAIDPAWISCYLQASNIQYASRAVPHVCSSFPCTLRSALTARGPRLTVCHTYAQAANGEVRMNAAQLTEHMTHAQLQAEVYRCISAKLAAAARGPLGFRLPGLGPAASEPDVAPAQYCLYQESPASAATPLQQRRYAKQGA